MFEYVYDTLNSRTFNTNFTILNKHQIEIYYSNSGSKFIIKIKAPNILGIYNTLGA